MARNEVQYIALDAAQMQRFSRNLPAALARRSGGFMAEQWMATGEMLMVGCVGLFGLWRLDWSPEGAVACLLLGIWAKIIGDLMKYCLARRALLRLKDEWDDDAQVWAVGNALKDGQTQLRADRVGGHMPGMGLFVDLAFGGVATGVIVKVSGLFRPETWQVLLAQPEWRWVLIGMVWWQLMTAAISTLRHAWLGERAGRLQFAAGGRGLGLFLLMFPVLMFYGESEGNARGVVLVSHLALIVFALIGFFGCWLLQRETRWLRDWHRREQAAETRI